MRPASSKCYSSLYSFWHADAALCPILRFTHRLVALSIEGFLVAVVEWLMVAGMHTTGTAVLCILLMLCSSLPLLYAPSWMLKHHKGVTMQAQVATSRAASRQICAA